jgi:hypothetical protein
MLKLKLVNNLLPMKNGIFAGQMAEYLLIDYSDSNLSNV